MKKLSLFLVALTLMLVSCKPSEIEKPIVETKTVVDITVTTAKVVGNIVTDGGSEVTAKGVCWAKTQNPTIENDNTNAGAGVGEFLVEIKGLESGVTYYVRAYATNEVGTSYGEEKCFTTLEIDDEEPGEPETPEEPEGTINGFEYVDLGLPSGLKWATINVGATEPDEVGSYYAWGEIKAKDEFYADNSLTYGMPLGDFSGNPEYDVAAASWGSTWRMPTEAEVIELKDNCILEWTVIGITPGCKVTGPNGNHIFMPSGGFATATTIDFIDSEAAYWTSTPDTSNGDLGFASFIYFYNNNYSNRGWMSRYAGILVRPVSE